MLVRQPLKDVSYFVLGIDVYDIYTFFRDTLMLFGEFKKMNAA